VVDTVTGVSGGGVAVGASGLGQAGDKSDTAAVHGWTYIRRSWQQLTTIAVGWEQSSVCIC
jgi:hypothetical protein